MQFATFGRSLIYYHILVRIKYFDIHEFEKSMLPKRQNGLTANTIYTSLTFRKKLYNPGLNHSMRFLKRMTY